MMERKRKAKISASKPKKKKFSNESENLKNEETKNESPNVIEPKTIAPTVENNDINDKYPILKDEELVKKFMGVSMSNNQKGRIRQTVKAYVTGATDEVIPQVLHDKMQEVLDTSQPLNESSLRKMRILYNMLKTALEKSSGDSPDKVKKTNKKKNKKSKKQKESNSTEQQNEENIEAKDSTVTKSTEAKTDTEKEKSNEKENSKVKGPKRYVVFVGNLPIDITAEKLKDHFTGVSKHIQDIRIPVRAEGKKSSIAYIELKNEAAYELALSKHHSMLANKRINVLYTAQKNGKISKTEAKSKAAKLVALQKAGKLLGSVPLHKKRSHRRALLKAARARENADNN